jgi:hypothetical protein
MPIALISAQSPLTLCQFLPCTKNSIKNFPLSNHWALGLGEVLGLPCTTFHSATLFFAAGRRMFLLPEPGLILYPS